MSTGPSHARRGRRTIASSPADDPGPFSGEGEARELGRSTEWAATSLGPTATWSPTLRTTVRTALASPFPVSLWCGPELVLVYNDAYRRVLGSKHPEAFGRPGRQVWSEIWDDIAAMFQRIRAGGAPVYEEDSPFWVRRAGGEQRRGRVEDGPNAWFTFSLSGVRDERDEIVAFLNIVSETTGRVLAERERRAARARAERAEARLLEVFAHAPAFMAVLRGPDHVFEYANHAYYDLVGDRDLIGRPVLEVLPEVQGQGFEELLDRVLRTGEPYVGREVGVSLSRGPDDELEERYVDFVYYPITEIGGERSGVVAHGSDVTEHVRHRQEAQQARAEAETANRAKSQFLATISHELRTPINAIMGYTELLDMEIHGPVNDAQRRNLGRLRDSSRHLLMLIDDILDLTRAESGRLDVTREPVRLPAVVASAVALVEPQAGGREISIESACPDIGARGLADEDRVRQILVNVLSNAVKFTTTGGRIRIECGTATAAEAPFPAKGGDRLAWVAVADTGIGIEEEHIRRIFEPFTQVESELGRTYGGTGLGLAISRQLALLMGGELTVRSEAGRGSTFTLWIPA